MLKSCITKISFAAFLLSGVEACDNYNAVVSDYNGASVKIQGDRMTDTADPDKTMAAAQ